jgi:thiamine transport system substrate-binding protein
MMLVLLLTLSLALFGNTQTMSKQGEPLIVYTYSSFVSFGLADVVAREFQVQTGSEVRFVATSDSRAMLSRLIAERDSAGSPPADVFVGVEVSDLSVAQANDVFVSLANSEIPNLDNILSEIRFDAENKLIPYEHGFITLVYNSDALAPEDVPQSLKDLLDEKYKDKIIVIDPRSSSPGLSFLLWSIAEFGEDSYLNFWSILNENILTITDSWDASFDLFSRGEAPIAISFSTDQAFDVIFNSSDRIQVLTPQGNAYRTIFGAGVVKDANQPELAKQFINILLSPSVQDKISETEFMIPANVNATARAIWFQNVIYPENPILLSNDEVSQNLTRWLSEWEEAVLGN